MLTLAEFLSLAGPTSQPRHSGHYGSRMQFGKVFPGL
jgi:hypothetical protein